MARARILENYSVELGRGQFLATVKIIGVAKNKKFPDGLKISCVLLDTEKSVAKLILDNHQPFGYHLHTKMPEDKNFRIILNVDNYEEAVKVFFKYAGRIINEK